MGLLQGEVRGSVFYVYDCFRLPVEGTETRVNAGEQAMEYMVQFTELNELTSASSLPVCGWYHSHPGYGCWLSGIDVDTQYLYQQHQDPFIAIVIDPKKTRENGILEIGAFRTLPLVSEGPSNGNLIIPDIPTGKAEDFGAHGNRYYSLEVEYVTSDVCSRFMQRQWRTNWERNIISPSRTVKIPAAGLHNLTPSNIKRMVESCSCTRFRNLSEGLMSASVFSGVRRKTGD